MRKLIFVDNDGIESANKCIKEFIKPFLIAYGNVPEDKIEIEVIDKLYKLDKDKLYDIFFSDKNAILSWSVYTLVPDQSNSKQQLLSFLRAARDIVKNAIYIDVSGMVEQTLYSAIKFDDTKYLFHILSAIQNNHIVTRAEGGQFVRLQINLTKKELFDHIEVDLVKLLEI